MIGFAKFEITEGYKGIYLAEILLLQLISF